MDCSGRITNGRSGRLGFTVEDDVTRPHGAVEKGVGKDVDS